MRNLLILMAFLSLMLLSGCDGNKPSALNKVEGIIIEVMYSSSEINEYVVQDSYGKNVKLKTNSSTLLTMMHVGDKVEIYYDNNFNPKKVIIRQNNI